MTPFIKKKDIKNDWYLINAENAVVGRLAAYISKVLRGKNKAQFNPHIDNGDFVIVTNIEKIKFTGKKFTNKKYYRHTGYPGGQRTTNPENIMAKCPERVVEKAVKGMLPKNRLGAQLFRNLHVYVGGEHKHEAQKPTAININEIK